MEPAPIAPTFTIVTVSPPESGGVRGGLRSALPLATEGTQEQPQTLPLPKGRKNSLY
ncbi:MAG: hypothetical protein IJ898_10185 [Prevotella sp.]|nr:hypothetical protein [Prevotella sp.]